jgi:hypothetical protein
MNSNNDHNQRPRAYHDPYLDNRDYDSDRTIHDEREDYRLINRTPTVANGSRTARPDSYRNGYVQRRDDRHHLEQMWRARDNESTARGFLLGILLTSLVGIVIAAVFFVSQQNRAPVPVVPAPTVEEPDTPEPQTNTNTQVRERVIERTRELVPVPVPQPSPAEAQPQAPVQSQQPAVEQAPTQQPSPVVQPEAQSGEPVLQPSAPATDG